MHKVNGAFDTENNSRVCVCVYQSNRNQNRVYGLEIIAYPIIFGTIWSPSVRCRMQSKP